MCLTTYRQSSRCAHWSALIVLERCLRAQLLQPNSSGPCSTREQVSSVQDPDWCDNCTREFRVQIPWLYSTKLRKGIRQQAKAVRKRAYEEWGRELEGGFLRLPLRGRRRRTRSV